MTSPDDRSSARSLSLTVMSQHTEEPTFSPACRIKGAAPANGEEWKQEQRLGNHFSQFARHSEPFATQASSSRAHLYTGGKGQRCHLLTESNSHGHSRQRNAIWSHVGFGILLKDILTNGPRGPETETLTAAVVT